MKIDTSSHQNRQVKAKWMQKETFQAENCILQKIIVRKDCSACPVTSPFGPLKVNENETFVFHDDSVIIWSKQNRKLEKRL